MTQSTIKEKIKKFNDNFGRHEELMDFARLICEEMVGEEFSEPVKPGTTEAGFNVRVLQERKKA